MDEEKNDKRKIGVIGGVEDGVILPPMPNFEMIDAMTAMATITRNPGIMPFFPMPYVGPRPHRKRFREIEKKAETCMLPGCETLTTHNGGYCCADHCKEHRRIRKQAK
jgi:hypothetical protein